MLRSALAHILVLVLTLGLVGCTCNKAGTSRKPVTKKGTQVTKVGKMRKSKFKRKGKGKRKSQVPRVDTTVFLLDQKKFDAGEADPWVPVKRKVGAKAPAKNAIWTLFKGPTDEEKAKGLTFISSGATGFQGFSIEGDTATLQLREGCDSKGGAISVYDHLSKTLKNFPEIAHVRVVGPNDSVPTGTGDHRPACLQP